MDIHPSTQKNLARIFKKYGITAAYLFGSQANGKTHPRSDTDIAVRYGKDLPLKKILALCNELSELLKTDIDLADLNRASLTLQFRIYKARRLLFAKNAKEEASLKAKSVTLYHDHKPFFERQNTAFQNHILAKGLL